MGHAYTTTLCDVLARYHRILGDDVYFLSGTDDHAIKVAKEAQKLGKDSRDFVIQKGEDFKKLYEVLNISNNDFIQTSDEGRHFAGAQEVWRRLSASGDIYKGHYKGLYCVGCEAFKKSDELVLGKCPLHDQVPEEVEEENYFFKLSNYSQKLQKLIESDELKITPETRKKEILFLIERGLDDVSFSRPKKSISWGIPVPNDNSQTMYVWCDALTNYITALGFPATGQNFSKFWPANVHVVGKDILRFHAAIWPAMLMSAGIALPKEIFVHGFITSGGKKMSKTIGNVVNPLDVVNEYGVDALRYYLTREVTPFEDGDFTMEHFKEVYNANLANGLGNLVARVMKMSEDNNVATLHSESAYLYSSEIGAALDRFEFHEATNHVWSRIKRLDQKITEDEPYRVVKRDPVMGKVMIQELVQGLYDLARSLEPFMPDTSQKILEAIKENKKPQTLFERKL